MADLSEFSDLETSAFDGVECKEGWPDRCLVLYFLAKQGEVASKSRSDKILSYTLEELTQNKQSMSNETKNTNVAWEMSCGLCGVTGALDILETNNKTFDKESGTSSADNLTLSKSGSRRARDEARLQMENIADAYGIDARGIREATRLFELFHKHGSSSGGRGHKVTVVAALRVASLNSGIPVPLSKLCASHPDKPNQKTVKRFINDARSNNLFNTNRIDALEFLSILVSKIETSPSILKEATRIAGMHLPGMSADVQACASLFLAAGQTGRRERRFGGMNLSKEAMINRKRIYVAAKDLRIHEKPLVLTNPAEEGSRQIPSTVVKQLRTLRRHGFPR
jgi:hypothetical protein